MATNDLRSTGKSKSLEDFIREKHERFNPVRDLIIKTGYDKAIEKRYKKLKEKEAKKKKQKK